MVFLPRDVDAAQRSASASSRRSIREEGQTLLGWRDVPVDASKAARLARAVDAGRSARSSSARRRDADDQDALERKLYVIRKRVEQLRARVRACRDPSASTCRACRRARSSTRACCCPSRSRAFYPDLTDPTFDERAGAGAPALPHQHVPDLGARASVPLHRAQRRDQHAARQRELDARARDDVRVAAVRRRHREAAADHRRQAAATRRRSTTRSSCCVHTGRSLPHAMMMMIPEAWQKHETHERRRSAPSTSTTPA